MQNADWWILNLMFMSLLFACVMLTIQKWLKAEFPFMKPTRISLKKHRFSLEIRPEQRQAANALLQGSDVLAALPTGFGTSLILKGLNVKQCWSLAHCKVLLMTRSQKQEEWECLPLRLPIFQMESQAFVWLSLKKYGHISA